MARKNGHEYFNFSIRHDHRQEVHGFVRQSFENRYLLEWVFSVGFTYDL